ncbi:hypothetical protein DFH06DRAFT_1334416 [Mycena polygramma]|nr:hypothetical protein DFH06DRAFT_1334416 [Mycena polygramma]
MSAPQDSSAPNLAVEYTLGPWLIGTCIELVLQGIISTQVRLPLRAIVFSDKAGSSSSSILGRFRDDPLALKLAVVALALMTYTLSILMFMLLWDQFAVNFGTIQVPHAYQIGLTMSAGIIHATVGFCSRLYLLSRKWYIVAPMVAIFLAAFAASMLGIAHFLNSSEVKTVALPAVRATPSIAAMTEASFCRYTYISTNAIDHGMAYYLIKCKKDVLPGSVGVLNALIRLTFQTAAPATICALVGFIFSLTFPEVFPFSRATAALASTVFLAKLYAFSMMWTLNARQHIRAKLNVSEHGVISPFNHGQSTIVADPELGTAGGKLSSESYPPPKQKSHLGRIAVKRTQDGPSDAEESDGDELVFARPRKPSAGFL